MNSKKQYIWVLQVELSKIYWYNRWNYKKYMGMTGGIIKIYWYDRWNYQKYIGITGGIIKNILV